MYIVERNKVTIEDLKDATLFQECNAGLLEEQPLVSTFNLLYKHFMKDTIYRAIIEVKEELDKIDEKIRPPLEFNMVYLKLLGKEVVTSENIIKYYKEYIDYRRFLCDGSCNKWSIFNIADLPQIYLTDIEKVEVEFDNIEAYLDEFIEFFDYPEDFDDPDTYRDYKYYKLAIDTYKLIDFSSLLPTRLMYEGFYSINDGGQGLYERSNDSFYDIGIVQKIKGLYYRRQYNRWVYSSWFGMQRKVEGSVFKYIIKYPNIKWNSFIHVRIDETIDVEVVDDINWVANGNSMKFDLQQADTAFSIICRANRVSMHNIEFISNKVDPVFILNEIETDIYSSCVFTPEAATPTLNNDLTRFMTNKDYNLDTAKFGVLPEVAKSINPHDLAVLGSIDLEEALQYLMTKSTGQIVIATHTFNDMLLEYTTKELSAAFKVEEIQVVVDTMKKAIKDKIQQLATNLIATPPIGYRYMSIQDYNTPEPMQLWPNTQWKKLDIDSHLVANNQLDYEQLFVDKGRTPPNLFYNNAPSFFIKAPGDTNKPSSRLKVAINTWEALGSTDWRQNTTIGPVHYTAYADGNYGRKMRIQRLGKLGKFTWSRKNVLLVTVWERIG